MSFGGEAIPAIFHHSFHTCFERNTTSRSAADKAYFVAAINNSLPQSIESATSQDRSYTNMYLMATITSILFGEMAQTNLATLIPVQRAITAKHVGYKMWDDFFSYTTTAGIHEFMSPTYTNVQLSVLYLGYMHTTNTTIRSQIESVLDYLWLELAANYYSPSAQLSGPHSRDYDFLLSHGMTDIDLYVIGKFQNMMPLRCEKQDPHCEGAPNGWNKTIGTGEPMTVLALDLYNIMSPRGYRVKKQASDLSVINQRTIKAKFLGQHVTANGNFGQFGGLYNYVHIDADNASGYAIGSASQEYITRTHGKYYPYPGSKLINIVLGSTYGTASNKVEQRPIPTISVQTSFMNSSYGLWKDYPSWSHADKGTHLASHPGNVQEKNWLLATSAIDALDLPDAFATSPSGVPGEYISLSTDILLPLHADVYYLVYANGTATKLDVASRDAPFQMSLPLGSTLALRVQTGGVAIKVIEMDGVNGQAPTLSLVGDAVGMSVGAVRLVCQHFASNVSTYLGESEKNTHVRFAALIVAESVSKDQDVQLLGEKIARAKTLSAVSKDQEVWETSLIEDKTGKELLAVARNLTCSEKGAVRYNQTVNTTWNCLLSRRVRGNEDVATFLEVNGVKMPHPEMPHPEMTTNSSSSSSSSSPSSPFTIDETIVGDRHVHTVNNHLTGESVEILTDWGGKLSRLRLRKSSSSPVRDVIATRCSDLSNCTAQDLESQSSLGALLIPFANRIENGTYTFANSTYHLTKDNSTISHGFLISGRPMFVASKITNLNEGTLELGYNFNGSDVGYPFKVNVRVRYTLKRDGSGLTVTISSTNNMQTSSAPFQAGAHPYFHLMNGNFNNTHIVLNRTCASWERQAQKVDQVPSGSLSAFVSFNGTDYVSSNHTPCGPACGSMGNGNLHWDDGFSSLMTSAGCSTLAASVEDGDDTLTLFLEDGFQFLQVYTGNRIAGVALEPMSGETNCFNNQQGLVVLKPQGEWRGSFRIDLS